VRRRIEWHESKHGGALGRHVEHDPRSRSFAVAPSVPGQRLKVMHRRHGRILDQGNLGSCTGNALVGAVDTEPLYRRRHLFREPMAVRLYSEATRLDEFDGAYPPNDTGSSGLAVCKAGVAFKLLTSYRHAFGIEQALDALQDGPVITGVDWYEGFDTPDTQGLVQIVGQIRGGHEFVVHGYTPATLPLDSLVHCDNSWGDGWGFGGSFTMSVRTWASLLDAQGDVTVPVR
jgi:hypothetical protein